VFARIQIRLSSIKIETASPERLAISKTFENQTYPKYTQVQMATTTDTDLQQLKDSIADLVQEMRLGFSRLDKQIEVGFAKVETSFAKIEGDMKELRSEIKALDTEFDEKTKNLDQRITSEEFINREVSIGLMVTIVGGILLVFGKALFFSNIG
jgi:Na+/phosphate symporter